MQKVETQLQMQFSKLGLNKASTILILSTSRDYQFKKLSYKIYYEMYYPDSMIPFKDKTIDVLVTTPDLAVNDQIVADGFRILKNNGYLVLTGLSQNYILNRFHRKYPVQNKSYLARLIKNANLKIVDSFNFGFYPRIFGFICEKNLVEAVKIHDLVPLIDNVI